MGKIKDVQRLLYGTNELDDSWQQLNDTFQECVAITAQCSDIQRKAKLQAAIQELQQAVNIGNRIGTGDLLQKFIELPSNNALYQKNVQCQKDNFFKENYEKLEIRQAEFEPKFLELSQYESGKHIYIKEDYNHKKIICLEFQGNIVGLNSQYDCSYEAQIWAESIKADFETPIILCGLGNGERVKALLNICGNNQNIFVYEPDIQIFLKCMEVIDLSTIIEDKRVFFFVENVNMEYFYRYFKRIISYNQLYNLQLFIAPNYGIYNKEINNFAAECKKNTVVTIAEANTYDFMGTEMLSNTLYNLPRLMKESTINQLIESISAKINDNSTAIVAAAGPSLDKNMHELYKAKGKALIIAVDTAVKLLMKQGIIPDIIISIDPQKKMEIFEYNGIEKLPLILCANSKKELLDRHTGKCFLFMESKFVSQLYQKYGHSIASLDTGGSVANSAFTFARLCGFKNIILVGQDLAFEGEKMHAGNVFDETYNESQYVQMEGYYGKPVYGYANFELYKNWFEAVMREYPDINVVNATEGGVKLNGAVQLPLKDAVIQYCRDNIDYTTLIHNIPAQLDYSIQQDIYSYIKNIASNRLKFKEKMDETIQLYKNLNSAIAHNNSLKAKKLLSRCTEFDSYVNNDLYMQLVSIEAKKQEKQIMDNMSHTREDVSETINQSICMINAYKSSNETICDMIETIYV